MLYDYLTMGLLSNLPPLDVRFILLNPQGSSVPPTAYPPTHLDPHSAAISSIRAQ